MILTNEQVAELRALRLKAEAASGWLDVMASDVLAILCEVLAVLAPNEEDDHADEAS